MASNSYKYTFNVEKNWNSNEALLETDSLMEVKKFLEDAEGGIFYARTTDYSDEKPNDNLRAELSIEQIKKLTEEEIFDELNSQIENEYFSKK
jgi:hypothetical protein